jgi:hypothetical protein
VTYTTLKNYAIKIKKYVACVPFYFVFLFFVLYDMCLFMFYSWFFFPLSGAEGVLLAGFFSGVLVEGASTALAAALAAEALAAEALAAGALGATSEGAFFPFFFSSFTGSSFSSSASCPLNRNINPLPSSSSI